MKKKNRFKFWLIKTLRNIIDELAPEKRFRVEHITVPLVTLNASITVPKNHPSNVYVTEFLSKRLGEGLVPYMNIETCEMNSFDFDDQITYRATVRVAADKRG